ncbi:uncharacterized protein BDR25DRAFT_357361 [Lindgomyces ingoldianus]|uniref:Uncharacterized protein n=1 Tax=Lindgomyces ingoldianus TaxID=673940 RepID=A0ACB6QND1_9PLEO|nr:uncharacterized protein BDR25DRAFT_357361 [Lindgomyces ingoldianus]KAF2468421.1 hypothetical protein BDR25DRAFT_357361 [Lindgomyces ingoldianus]
MCDRRQEEIHRVSKAASRACIPRVTETSRISTTDSHCHPLTPTISPTRLYSERLCRYIDNLRSDILWSISGTSLPFPLYLRKRVAFILLSISDIFLNTAMFCCKVPATIRGCLEITFNWRTLHFYARRDQARRDSAVVDFDFRGRLVRNATIDESQSGPLPLFPINPSPSPHYCLSHCYCATRSYILYLVAPIKITTPITGVVCIEGVGSVETRSLVGTMLWLRLIYKDSVAFDNQSCVSLLHDDFGKGRDYVMASVPLPPEKREPAPNLELERRQVQALPLAPFSHHLTNLRGDRCPYTSADFEQCFIPKILTMPYARQQNPARLYFEQATWNLQITSLFHTEDYSADRNLNNPHGFFVNTNQLCLAYTSEPREDGWRKQYYVFPEIETASVKPKHAVVSFLLQAAKKELGSPISPITCQYITSLFQAYKVIYTWVVVSSDCLHLHPSIYFVVFGVEPPGAPMIHREVQTLLDNDLASLHHRYHYNPLGVRLSDLFLNEGKLLIPVVIKTSNIWLGQRL